MLEHGRAAAAGPSGAEDGEVPRDDVRLAATLARDSGLHRVSRLTWRAGVASLACSAVIGVALAHQSDASAGTTHPQHGTPGRIVIPATPPQPSGGAGQVNSGAS
jgi:hypothetical protein